MAKNKSIKVRVSGEAKQAEASLQRNLSIPLPDMSWNVQAQKRVLATLRALMAAADRTRAEMTTLKKQLVKDLQYLFDSASFDIEPADLGVKSVNELAGVLVKLVKNVRYDRYTVAELRSKAVGLRGVFNGELFELLVANQQQLQQDLKLMAAGQRLDLNQLIQASSNQVADGRGAKIQVQGIFRDIQKAGSIFVWKDGKKLKFIDSAYVSELIRPGGGSSGKFTFLVRTEIKLPAAAKGFGEQIGGSNIRFSEADRIEFLVEGESAPRVIDPEDLVFSNRAIPLAAITLTSKGQNQYRFSFTNKGGYTEAYLRVQLSTVQVQTLNRITNVLLKR